MKKLKKVLVMSLLISSAIFADEKVPLELELPDAIFIGTPEKITSENLEPRPNGKRPALLVPKGVTNLALEKKVTSSDIMPIIGDITQVTDGDKEADEGCFVELAPLMQWIQIDLEKSYDIYAVAIWHFHGLARIYIDIIIQISDDPKFEKGVTTIFNNDHDNSSELGKGKDYEYVENNLGKLIDAQGVKGRYIRCYSNGNTANEMNHYTEVEVFGK